jgi:hypothetical protein
VGYDAGVVACVRDVRRSFFLADLLLCLMQAAVTSARGVPLDVTTTTKRPHAQPTTSGMHRHAMRGFALCVSSSLTASGARPISAATPLLVADVLDISHQNRHDSHYEFIAVLMSGHEGEGGGFSKDRIRTLCSRQQEAHNEAISTGRSRVAGGSGGGRGTGGRGGGGRTYNSMRVCGSWW